MVQTRSQARGDEKEPAPLKPVKPAPSKTQTVKKEKGKTKASGDETASSKKIDTDKIRQLIAEHGSLPFHNTKLAEPDKPTASTILAHVIDALLKSTRISHNIANETMKVLVEEGYQDVKVLQATSWEERREVLERGGYSHYKEKTSTQLGDLAEWVINKYGWIPFAPFSSFRILAIVSYIRIY